MAQQQQQTRGCVCAAEAHEDSKVCFRLRSLCAHPPTPTEAPRAFGNLSGRGGGTQRRPRHGQRGDEERPPAAVHPTHHGNPRPFERSGPGERGGEGKQRRLGQSLRLGGRRRERAPACDCPSRGNGERFRLMAKRPSDRRSPGRNPGPQGAFEVSMINVSCNSH